MREWASGLSQSNTDHPAGPRIKRLAGSGQWGRQGPGHSGQCDPQRGQRLQVPLCRIRHCMYTSYAYIARFGRYAPTTSYYTYDIVYYLLGVCHNTSRVILKMLPDICMEPMRFARFEAKISQMTISLQLKHCPFTKPTKMISVQLLRRGEIFF